ALAFVNTPVIESVSGVAFDAYGNGWYADYGNCTVTELSPAGTIAAVYGVGTNCADVSEPMNIVVDPLGNIWVGNPANNSVTKMTPSGTILGEFPLYSNLYGNGPIFMAIDGAGDVWVTCGAGLVELDPSGKMLQSFTGDYCGLAIAIDRSGNVWIPIDSS